MRHKIVFDGDLKDIKELRRIYNQVFAAKERFIDLAVRQHMTPFQRAEADLKLAVLTGELKQIDGLIHYMMFGGPIIPNELCEPLIWQADKNLSARVNAALERIKAENQDLREHNSYLNALINSSRRGPRQKKFKENLNL